MGREQEEQRLQELGDFLRTRRARLGYLLFEHLTFQVVDVPDLKVNVFTPLDIADTPAKLSQLLAERASVSSGF